MSAVKLIKRAVRPAFEMAYRHHPDNAVTARVAAVEGKLALTRRVPDATHLTAAIGWIKNAQDATGDGGVSWGFRAGRNFRDAATLGWNTSYPETTGYIIPTLLRYGLAYADADAIARARRMTDWEVSIQLANGGFQGGKIGETPVQTSTFVTGQVLFGLVAAYEHFGDRRYLDAGIRAGIHLLDCLDDAGRFVRGFSAFCEPGAKAYEARTGLAIALLGRAADDQRFTKAAEAMAAFAMRCQRPNGWFESNDLDHHDKALTHTIGYVMEGLHGIGTLLGRPDMIAAVDRTLDAIVPLVPADGFLPERWTEGWQPTTVHPDGLRSVCLTGSSQIAGVLLRRCKDKPNAAYLDAAERLLSCVGHSQSVRIGEPGIDGGVRGSYPIAGAYGQYCTLNWATKFFADSVMDHIDLTAQRR